MENGKVVLAVGARFNNLEEPKTTCRETAVRDFFEFETLKSNANLRYTIQCKTSKAAGCPWRLHASPIKNTRIFVIRIFSSKHSCYGITGNGHPQATATLIASTIAEKLRDQPSSGPSYLSPLRYRWGCTT
jgi:zinc finger SWIM domain-containing protein 3